MKDSNIKDIIRAAALVLSGRSAVADAIGMEARRTLELNVPEKTGIFSESASPVTAFIGEALKYGTSATRPLLDVLAPALPYLPWKYNYKPHNGVQNPEQHMAWGEIIGPEAPYVSNSFCFGFTLIAPHSLYPAHFHPATELYYVLSGTAEWTLNGKSSMQAPGSFILHPSNAIHSMRTASEPLLALYTWSGSDVVTLSQYAC